MNINLSISKTHFVLQISPLILQRNSSVFKIFIWISVFRRRKNGLEICFLVPKILNKSYSCIFFETPCWLLSNPRNKQIGFDNFYETPCSTIFKSILQVKPVIFLALLRIQYGSKCVAISRMC